MAEVDFAKQVAAMAKKYPTASAGVVTGLAKAGVDPASMLASQAVTIDGQARVNSDREAARTAAAKLREANNSGDGSPVDWLAPITRTAFMALTTPFELIESSVRNIAGGKPIFENVIGQTSGGQALQQLITTGKVDVGTGFLDVDPNSAVGKAMYRAKIKAGPKMASGRPWTYQAGLTQALFDNPETKAARTFEAVSGFILNLALDPLTYVPGIGLLKVGKGGVELRVGLKALAKRSQKVVRDDTAIPLEQLGKTREERAAVSGRADRIVAIQNAIDDELTMRLPDSEIAYQALHSAKSAADMANAEFGDLARLRETLFKDLKTAEQQSQLGINRKRTLEEVQQMRMGLKTPSRTADVDAILTTKGDQAVIETANRLADQEPVLPGLVHTMEPAALKKGGRVPTLGIADGAEQIVRVAGAKQPTLAKFTSLVMPGDSPQAARLGNSLFDALADIPKAAPVVDEILREGATHADVVAAAEKAGVLDELYTAYRNAGIGGFSNVGGLRDVAANGGYAYFKQTVDSFQSEVSVWAKESEIPTLAPEVVDAGTQAPTIAGAVAQQATALYGDAMRPRWAALRSIEDIDTELARLGKIAEDKKTELADVTRRYEAQLLETQNLMKIRETAKSELEDLNGLDKQILDAEFGLLHIDDTKILDYQKFADSMFGPLGSNVAKMIAEGFTDSQDDVYRLWNLLGRKIDVEDVKQLAAASSEKEVLGLFAKGAGLDLNMYQEARLASRAMDFKSGIFNPHTHRIFRATSEKFLIDSGLVGFLEKASDSRTLGMFTRMAPSKGLIHLDDVDELTRQMHDTIPFLRGSNELRDKYVKKMMFSETPSERFNIFINAIQDIVAEQSGKLTDVQRQMLDDAARVFRREAEANRNYLAMAGKEKQVFEQVIDGKKFSFGPNEPFIDAQLTNYVRWPNVEEMRQITGAMRGILSANVSGQKMRSAITNLFDTRFKQLVLVGRVSYIQRNILDMNIRSYLTGSMTPFSHPMQFLALMLANPKGSAVQRQLAKYERFSTTVAGVRWSDLLDETDNAKMAGAATSDLHGYSNLMGREIGRGVGQDYRPLPTGMRQVLPTERGFNRGWANAILTLRASQAARLVAGGLESGYQVVKVVDGREVTEFVPFFKDAANFITAKKAAGVTDYDQLIVDFMMETKQGNDLRKLIANVDIDARWALVDDDVNVARQAVEVYFKAVRQAVDNTSAGSREIRNIIAGNPIIDAAGNRVVLSREKKAQDLAGVLAGYRKSVDVENAVGQVRIFADDLRSGEGVVAAMDRGSGWFFNIAARFEKRMSLGPEFRQQYYNAVADNVAFLSKAEGAKLLAVAEKELRGLKILGIPASAPNPALVKIRQGVKQLDEGGITLDDLDAIASTEATKAINKLFYDATRQKQYASAARIAAPFIAAWANTLGTWGSLITKDVANTFRLQGQARAYKAANAYEYLNHPETGVIYEWMGDNWGDPSQGFLYKDPTYGDVSFMIPLAGDVLGAMLEPIAGTDVPGMPVSISVPSLNLAFSQELLPGFGPAIQLSVGKWAQSQNNWAGDQLRQLIYPFGAPDKGTGIVETFTPAWAQRILYGLYVDSYEGKNLSTLRPLMAYLASSGKYGNMPLTGEDQIKLVEDAARVNRMLALWRGIMQNVSPGSIKPLILAKDKSGEFHVQALMVNDFAQIRANNPDNYMVSVAKWADKYGEDALAVLASGTRGGITPTDKAWEFYVNNRDDANKFPNAFSLFFPGGQYSTEYAKWQSQAGQRFELTPAEIAMEATRYVYTARKAKLLKDEATAIQQGVDPKLAHEAYLKQKDAMDMEFGGEPDYRSAGVPRETLVKELSSAVKSPKFAATESGKGLAEFLKAREAAYQVAEQNDYKTLTGKNMSGLASWLDNQAYSIISQYPEFSVMYWRVFATETGNN